MLIEQQLVADNPQELGRFLFFCDRLDKVQVGEYLADMYDYHPLLSTALSNLHPFFRGNQRVLRQFCKLIDFRTLDFDLALR